MRCAHVLACAGLLLLTLSGDASSSVAPTAPSADALTPEQAREDLELAIAAVEAGLPDPGWFQAPGEWRRARREARAAVADVVDAEGLFRVLRPLLSRIGEGHLVLRRSEAMKRRDAAAQGLLPLDLHWTTAGTLVMAGWGEAADIARGTRLLAIDGEPVEALVPELMAALGHDGRIATGAMREAEGAGYAWVRHWLRGGAARYRLRLQDPAGRISVRDVPGIAAAGRSTATAAAEASPVATLRWLDGRVAHLSVPSFSNRRYRAIGRDYALELRGIFERLQTAGAQGLILDLRDNGGGSEGNENLLFAHLVREPVRKYASVTARASRLTLVDAGGRRHRVEVFDAEELREQRRRADGQLARRNLPPLGLMSHWTPAEPVFEGRVVVLAGGRTFSGGSELASLLFHSGRALFVGEEAGGADAGNTSGYSWDIELPHSRMTLEVPLLRFRFAWRSRPHGRGVMPHCPVAPDLPGSNRDRALEVAARLLSQAWTPARPPPCPDSGATAPPSEAARERSPRALEAARPAQYHARP